MEKLIYGCFGESDLIFAGHPNDENRAFNLLTYCRENEIGWSKTQEALEKYLIAKGASDAHIKEQLQKAKSAMKFWLLD